MISNQFFQVIDQIVDDEPHDSQQAFMALLRDRIETDPATRDAFIAWGWEELRSKILQVAIRRAQERARDPIALLKEQSQHES